MYHMYYNTGILGWVMSIMHMALPILVVFLILNFFSEKKESKVKNLSVNIPFDLLKERYVRGEISREEFMRMKDDING